MSQDFAFLRLPDGRTVFGKGGFQSFSEPVDSGCFYVNDFSLSDPAPWKKPLEWAFLSGDNLPSEGKPFKIHWNSLEEDGFEMVFRRVRRDLRDQKFEKMVPALSQKGKILSGDALSILPQLHQLSFPFRPYAFQQDQSGFIGATPERFLDFHDHLLETTALAGTARVDDQKRFEQDVKESHEHELVADYLQKRLETVGDVHRHPREILEAGRLAHFQTRLEAKITLPSGSSENLAQRLNEWIRLFHPTPAVGCWPDVDENLNRLLDMRRFLQVPDAFGAPFGFWHQGSFSSVVAIRGLFWNQNEVLLPSGCGVVLESVFDHEWRELQMKRQAARESLGL